MKKTILTIIFIGVININLFGFDLLDAIRPNNMSYISTSGETILVNDTDKIPKCNDGMERHAQDKGIAMITLVPFIDFSECLPKEVVSAMYANDLKETAEDVITMVIPGGIGYKIVKNAKNGYKVYKLLNTMNKTGQRVRRITQLEKNLINSKGAVKTRIMSRTVIKRNIFECTQANKALMLKGNAPFGIDGKRVNLHHLKQQKDGNLIELTESEHNEHSKVLHRYVRKGSDITDRNTNFQSFRKSYWRSRAADCIARSK